MVGSDATDTITVQLSTLTASSLGLTSTTDTSPADLVGGSADVSLAAGATASFDVNGTTVTIGDSTSTSAQTLTVDDIATAINTALSSVSGNTVTASVDSTTGKLTLANSATGTAASTTIDNFSGITASNLGFTSTSSTGAAAGDLSVSTQAGATAALDAIDAAINSVSNARAGIGATESRFEFRAETIATSSENLKAANSAITDVDVASESAKLASAEVKTQAAVAAAAQANQMPQQLLKLMQ
jgi:flagellin